MTSGCSTPRQRGRVPAHSQRTPTRRVELKAAALLHSLARNHPLVDGNKRLSWLAVVVFLDLNGCEVTLSDEEAFQLVMDVACGDIELEEIVRRLQVSSTS